jgi:hypothetical protein
MAMEQGPEPKVEPKALDNPITACIAADRRFNPIATL